MNALRTLWIAAPAVLAGAAMLASTAGAQALRHEVPALTRAASSAKPPDANGYVQRWLLLEPVTIAIHSNQQLTDSFVQPSGDWRGEAERRVAGHRLNGSE
jgi:hypothetical protein